MPTPAPIPEPAVTAPASPAPRPRPGKRTLAGVGAVVLAIVVGGAIIATVGSSSSSDQVDTSGLVIDAPAADLDDPSDASASATDSTDEDSAATAAAAPTVRCWNGRTRARVELCPPPRGMRGLALVFPDSTLASCSRRGSPQRNLSVWCLEGGSEAHYSEWSSVDGAVQEYRSQISTRAPKWRGYLRWNIAARDGRSKLALVHPTLPFSVTLYADTPRARDAALRDLSLRPVRAPWGS